MEQAEGLEANQRQANLLLICRGSRHQDYIDQLRKRRLLDEQQMLNDQLFDDIQLNLNRIRPQTVFQRCSDPGQA